MKLCSACLLGIKCRFDGQSKPNHQVLSILSQETLIPFCPEQLGGLATPRPRCEIKNGSGEDVLHHKAQVVDEQGKDYSPYFLAGAQESLKLAQTLHIDTAIMRKKSPSCGCGLIFDGTFSDTLIPGDGVTTALFKAHGIKVIPET